MQLTFEIDSVDSNNQKEVQNMLQQFFKQDEYMKQMYEFSKFLSNDLPETTDVCYIQDDVIGLCTYLPLTICYKQKVVQMLLKSLQNADKFDKQKYFNMDTKLAFVLLNTAINLSVECKIGLLKSLIENQKWTQSKQYLQQQEIVYKSDHFKIDYLIFVDKNPAVEGTKQCDKNSGHEVFYDNLRKDKRVQVFYSSNYLVDDNYEFNTFYIVKLSDFSNIMKDIDK